MLKINHMLREIAIFRAGLKAIDPELDAAAVRLQKKLQKLFDQVASEIKKNLENKSLGNDPVVLTAPFKTVEDNWAAVIEAEIKAMEALPKTAEQLLREQAFEASKKTLDRLRGDISDLLANAVNEGLGVGETSRQLRDVFTGMRDWELKRIARNEMKNARAIETYQKYLDSGLAYNQWFSALSDTTRDSHADNHGKITRVGGTFPNGQRFPGDRQVDISEWINCQCQIVPFIMPRGYMPPPGMDVFEEGDLIKIAA